MRKIFSRIGTCLLVLWLIVDPSLADGLSHQQSLGVSFAVNYSQAQASRNFAHHNILRFDPPYAEQAINPRLTQFYQRAGPIQITSRVVQLLTGWLPINKRLESIFLKELSNQILKELQAWKDELKDEHNQDDFYSALTEIQEWKWPLIKAWLPPEDPVFVGWLWFAAKQFNGPRPMLTFIRNLFDAILNWPDNKFEAVSRLSLNLNAESPRTAIVDPTWATRNSMRSQDGAFQIGKYRLRYSSDQITAPNSPNEIALIDYMNRDFEAEQTLYDAASRLSSYWHSDEKLPHGTTLSALWALQGLTLQGQRVLEAGSGDGALAIAAAKEGAHVIAVDLPEISPLTEVNTARNGVLDHVRVIGSNLNNLTVNQTGPIDVIIFNLPFGKLEILQRLLSQYPSVKAVIFAGSSVSDQGELERENADVLRFPFELAKLNAVKSYVVPSERPYHWTEEKDGVDIVNWFSTIYVTRVGEKLLRDETGAADNVRPGFSPSNIHVGHLPTKKLLGFILLLFSMGHWIGAHISQTHEDAYRYSSTLSAA